MKNQIFYAVQISYEHVDDMVILFKKYEDALERYRRECQGYAGTRRISLKKFDLSIGGYDSETKIKTNEVE